MYKLHTSSFFGIFFHLGHYRALSRVPCAVQQVLISNLVYTQQCIYVRRRQWQPIQYSCLENLVDGGAWQAAVHGVAKSPTRLSERLHFHFSLSCIAEGNGNPLQCSCLENPRDEGAWWAAVYGVAQSRIRLKLLSSSSSIYVHPNLLICPTTLCPVFLQHFFYILEKEANYT